jgi:hypothetical protein
MKQELSYRRSSAFIGGQIISYLIGFIGGQIIFLAHAE